MEHLVTAPVDAYAAWAPSYPPRAHNALMEVEQTAVLELLPPVSGRVVLDAGCGTGRYMRLLAALGARVVGVDLSAAMASRARGNGLAVARGDMRRLPVATSSCDIVVSGLALPDLPTLDDAVREWARVLRHRGVVVASTLHPIGRELGWKRTYQSADRTCSLPACWHTRADFERSFAATGLELETIRESSLSTGGPPVTLVVRARRRR